jgi:hypothetical protein
VGSTNATLKIAPGEVVSVPLPPVGRGGEDAEAFAARAVVQDSRQTDPVTSGPVASS